MATGRKQHKDLILIKIFTTTLSEALFGSAISGHKHGEIIKLQLLLEFIEIVHVFREGPKGVFSCQGVKYEVAL